MAERTEMVVVEQSLPAERLDTFLRSKFPAVSRGTLKRLIEDGQILVDGRMVKPTHTPRKGEQVQVHWPEARSAEAHPEPIALDVLYEDEVLLVVNKAAGLVVHPASGNERHTLVNALLHHCAGQLSGIGGVARPGIVHRLDKDTSGCLVVAKNDQAHLALSAQFASRKVKKLYQAIVCGEVLRGSGEIHAAIARHCSHRKCMAVDDENGREASTTYKVIERLPSATHVEVAIQTGRTHQIRVHFQYLGYPVVGDDIYGQRRNLRLTELTGYTAPRQMLHSFHLSFIHPRTAKRMAFEAPLPADFQEALATLRPGPPG